MRRVFLLAGVALTLAGCGDTSITTAMKTTESSLTSSKQYSGELPPGITDEPTQALVRQWPRRWCQAAIGISRIRLVEMMGAVPTKADSGMIPHIPYIRLNAKGENETPPKAAGSDTWAAPGPYLFNAFYDPSLHVQQLDFSGPEQKIGCASTRVG